MTTDAARRTLEELRAARARCLTRIIEVRDQLDDLKRAFRVLDERVVAAETLVREQERVEHARVTR